MQTRVINIPLYGGIDTKTDDKSVPTNKSLLLENAIMQNTGEVRKRNGYENLVSGTIATSSSFVANDIQTGNSIHSYDGSLVIVGTNTTETQLRSFNGPGIWSKADGKDSWVRIGNYVPVTFSVERITSSSEDHAIGTVAYGNRQYMVVYQDGTSVMQDIIDRDTGTVYRERHALLTPSSNPKAVFVNDGYGKGTLMSLSNGTSSGVMVGVIIDPDDPMDISTTWNPTSGNDARTNSISDMGVINYPAHYDDTAGNLDAYSEAVVAYENDSGPTISVVTVNSAGNEHRRVILAQAPGKCLSVYVRNNSAGITERIYVVYDLAATGDVKCYVLNPDLTTEHGPQLILAAGTNPIRNITMTKADAEAKSSGVSSNRIFIEESDPSRDDRHFVTSLAVNYDGTGNSGTVRKSNHVGLVSKAFEYRGQAFVIIRYSTSVQPTYFLATVMDNTDMVFCAKIFSSTAGAVHSVNGLSDIVKTGESQFTAAITRTSRLLSDTAREYQVALTTFEMNPDALQSVRVGPNMLIGGGIITGFDGMSQEHGFHLYPENITLDTSSATGGKMVDGYRSYKAVYSWADRNGQIHRSAPSPAKGSDYLVGTDTQSQVVNVGYLCQQDFDNKSSSGTGQGFIEIYRTTSGGSIFYLVTNTRSPNSAVLDELSIESGNESDIDMSNNEIIYTNGGVLDSISPPASNILAATKDRVFLVPMDDDKSVWYSKKKLNGIGMEFSDSLVLRIDSGGANTGLASLDDKIIIFKEREIYFIAGDGPNSLNQGGGFSQIRRISSDVGCVSQTSVVSMGKGVMFKSHKGIYLLDRSLQIIYIGAPVEEWNQYDIISSTLIEDKNQVRFILGHGKGALVYDYHHNMWSRFTNHPAKDSVVHDGTYYWLKSDGIVKKENDGFRDVNFKIPIKIRTGWIKLGGMQGYQRVRKANILGEYKSPHSLTVKIYYDYDEVTVGQTVTFDSSSAMSGNEPLQYQIHIAKQKCNSIMFEIYDNSNDSTLEGCALTSIALEIGAKKGTNKLPPRKRD